MDRPGAGDHPSGRSDLLRDHRRFGQRRRCIGLLRNRLRERQVSHDRLWLGRIDRRRLDRASGWRLNQPGYLHVGPGRGATLSVHQRRETSGPGHVAQRHLHAALVSIDIRPGNLTVHLLSEPSRTDGDRIEDRRRGSLVYCPPTARGRDGPCHCGRVRGNDVHGGQRHPQHVHGRCDRLLQASETAKHGQTSTAARTPSHGAVRRVCHRSRAVDGDLQHRVVVGTVLAAHRPGGKRLGWTFRTRYFHPPD